MTSMQLIQVLIQLENLDDPTDGRRTDLPKIQSGEEDGHCVKGYSREGRMSTNVSPTGTTSPSNTGQTVANAVNKTLGQDDFLKLLIAQMENQDPTQPTDDTQFIAELAQFSSLEQMTNVATAVNTSNMLQGAALIGKNITGTDANNNPVSGVVDSVAMNDGNITVQVGSQSLPLSQVTNIT